MAFDSDKIKPVMDKERLKEIIERMKKFRSNPPITPKNIERYKDYRRKLLPFKIPRFRPDQDLFKKDLDKYLKRTTPKLDLRKNVNPAKGGPALKGNKMKKNKTYAKGGGVRKAIY